jgi:hypothetical protein
MPQVRIFNPSSYTARSYFARRGGQEGEKNMAHKKHHHYRRRNPLGVSGTVVKDAAFSAAGALGALFLSGQFGASNPWAGVGITAAASFGLLFAGKFIAPTAGEELFKGGLTATIISALHAAGIAKSIGLGLYSPSWFAVPTAGDQYMRNYAPQMAGANRGAGTIYFPGPGSPPVAMLPPAKGMGFHRFRSRYAGNY